MRYSAPLHTSRRWHILKSRPLSGIISLLWLVGITLLILLFVHNAHLDPSQLFGGFLISLARTSTAYIIALVLSVGLALLLSTSSVVETLLLPFLDVMQSFPSFALFPVLMTALARAPEAVIIFVLTLEMIWPILFSIIGAIKNRQETLEEAATIFGARGWKRLTAFTLPELMPAIVTGSIVGWGEGWEFIIGAELLVHATKGIGSYLGLLGDTQQSNLLALGIVILMLLLFAINKVLWLPLLHRVTQYGSES
jgi:NitT/TauT family transport system permease protein